MYLSSNVRLSDVGLASSRKGKSIKAGGIRRWVGANMSEDWTSGWRIGRCVGRRFRSMNLGNELRRSNIAPRRLDVARR